MLCLGSRKKMKIMTFRVVAKRTDPLKASKSKDLPTLYCRVYLKAHVAQKAVLQDAAQ